jgi:hypothetical protein
MMPIPRRPSRASEYWTSKIWMSTSWFVHRDQRLPELLALVPAQEDLLDDEPEDGDAGRGGERREHPLEGVHLGARDREPGARHLLLDVVGDVAAQQVERAVGHVHDPHEPEDEREAARDDEEQPGEGQPVHERDREVPRVVDRRAEVRVVREEEDPEDRQGDRAERDDPRGDL